MRRYCLPALAMLAAVGCVDPAAAQSADAGDLRVSWEVKNRFRLFRHESDFQRHAAAERGDGVLGAERRLAEQTGGRGWARLMLNSLCVDAGGRLLETCEREGVRESYLAPKDHRIGVLLRGAPAGSRCAWTFESPDIETQRAEVGCDEEVRLFVPYGRPTIAVAEVQAAEGEPRRASAEIMVRDLLIAGLGDSIASGEGNPDRPIALEDQGFCFRRVVATGRGGEYFRPGRAGYRGNKTCEASGRGAPADPAWARAGANWMSAACHRSLYSYQLRTALALAVENRQIAVTFVPLACTGADIDAGLLNGKKARELACGGQGRKGSCPSSVPPQIAQMKEALAAARRVNPNRLFDIVLLTVGANDIRFSELVADIILDDSAERSLVARGGGIATVEQAQDIMRARLPQNFARLRAALKPLVGNDLSRVVFVSYANPAMAGPGTPCNGGRDGFDIHPAFTVDADKARHAAAFVERQFLPGIRALALCEGGVLCQGAADRMTFVDAHQPAFADHGFCARADSDPAFDRECFRADGQSFEKSAVTAVRSPLACELSAKEFRPYARRARWIRTPNDSYFTAMSYPDNLSSVMQPADIHDALWGVVSAVYGGAMHPTAEGHAAMADAALPSVRGLLGLEQEHEEIETRPLPAPAGGPDYPRNATPIFGGPPGR
jgi:hypothetical protein